MSIDNPTDKSSGGREPNDGNKTGSDKSPSIDNILNIIGLKKPALRIVKPLNAASAKIIPFKRPLGLIIGGFALSIYALV